VTQFLAGDHTRSVLDQDYEHPRGLILKLHQLLTAHESCRPEIELPPIEPNDARSCEIQVAQLRRARHRVNVPCYIMGGK
jgi:hypothetical protein